jgi:non-ribosomal peptide synthetase component F
MLVSRQFPLSAYQRDIWAAEFAVPAPDPQFNVVLQERLTGQVDTAALTASLDHVLRHTDAFALRFDDHDGVPHQWFAAEESDPWVVYVDHSAAADPAAACAEWQKRSFSTPFTLRRSRLFTAAVLRESATVAHLHLNAHHLLADAYALNEISRRVWAEYARRTGAVTTDVAVETETAAGSVATLLEAAAAYEGSPAQERDRAHHREALAGVEPALFTAASPSADGVRRRVRHSFTVEADLVRRIRQGGSSPFAFLTAAFAAYLARIHRSVEAVVGVPFLNRRGAAELAAVGQVANSLPVRIPVAADATLHQLAAQVRTTTDALRPHERLALGDLLRELPADPAGNRRLFDVTVSYLRFPRPAALPGLTREITVKAPVHAQDALSVMVHAFEDDADIRVDLDGSLDVFDEDFPLSSVAGHLLSLVRAGVERPERAAVTLPLLDQGEYKNLTQAWQGEDIPYADGRTVHGLIAEQAARTPERTAVAATEGAGPLSYAELDARANQVARALAARGVGTGDRVAVLMDRSPLLIVALLGVLKAGGAYVPVDPGYPAERIRLLLEDSRAAVVLTGGDTAPTGPEAPATTVPVLPVDTLLTGPDDPFDSPAGPHDLAYVIYTSGSTGRPKGVMVEHHSVINRLAWMQKRYPVGAEDVVLQKTPISFDVSVWELFWWAIEGAGLALLPVGGQKDPRQILDTIAAQQVTTLHFVPSMLGPFLDLLEISPELLDAGRLPADRVLQRRGPAARPRRAVPPRLRRPRCPAPGQPLRADRGHGRRVVPRLRRRTRQARTPSPDRSPRRQHAAVRPRRVRRSPADRCPRRAVHRRRPGGPRLSGPARADRREVRGGPLHSRRQALPHRRPGALAGRRHPGVPRPDRRPGQDPRQPGGAR